MSHMEVGNLQGTYVITYDTIFLSQNPEVRKKMITLIISLIHTLNQEYFMIVICKEEVSYVLLTHWMCLW